jgi:molybdopterin synthase catalytic subunit
VVWCVCTVPFDPLAHRVLAHDVRGLRLAVRHVAVAHRVGVVPVGESSVEIAISSTHRKEALEVSALQADVLARASPPSRNMLDACRT